MLIGCTTQPQPASTAISDCEYLALELHKTNVSATKELKERRDYLNLTQKDVAEMAGITFKSISEIELGIRNPSINTLNKVLGVLGLELSVQIKTMN